MLAASGVQEEGGVARVQERYNLSKESGPLQALQEHAGEAAFTRRRLETRAPVVFGV